MRKKVTSYNSLFFPENFPFFLSFGSVMQSCERMSWSLWTRRNIKIWDLTSYSYNDPPQNKHVCWGSHVGGGCGNRFFVQQQFLDLAPTGSRCTSSDLINDLQRKKDTFCCLAWLRICGTFFWSRSDGNFGFTKL